MIFALATDERTLMSFNDLNEAISYCEAIDIEAGGWEFWGQNGEALVAIFLEPNEGSRWHASNGTYSLQPSANGPDLLASLPRVRQLDANPHFASLAALADYLAKGQPHGADQNEETGKTHPPFPLI
ncbi:hypothetical protein PQU63_03605 [Xanthomonas protegens]